MKRVLSISSAGSWPADTACDRIVLDAGDRNRRRIVLTGEQGTSFMLDFPKPVSLRDGDGLMLDDGSVIAVAGAPEALLEVAGPNAFETIRLAWHLGNRHTDVQIVGGKVRLRYDHVLEDMLRGLGASVGSLEAPFDPEPASPHGHGHHDHGHNDHGHPEHGHHHG